MTHLWNSVLISHYYGDLYFFIRKKFSNKRCREYKGVGGLFNPIIENLLIPDKGSNLKEVPGE